MSTNPQINNSTPVIHILAGRALNGAIARESYVPSGFGMEITQVGHNSQRPYIQMGPIRVIYIEVGDSPEMPNNSEVKYPSIDNPEVKGAPEVTDNVPNNSSVMQWTAPSVGESSTPLLIYTSPIRITLRNDPLNIDPPSINPLNINPLNIDHPSTGHLVFNPIPVPPGGMPSMPAGSAEHTELSVIEVPELI